MEHIIAGTGHRPSYFPNKYNEHCIWVKDVKHRLDETIKNQEISCIISGMALGWDIFLAEAALENNIPLKCYLPFSGQEDRWPPKAKRRYYDIIENATETKIIADNYSQQAYLDRDKEMMMDCDEVFALWNPEVNSGGTYFTIIEAKKLNKTITNFWPE